MLRGKIDKDGFLSIYRGIPEQIVQVRCPYSGFRFCNHDCALFGSIENAMVQGGRVIGLKSLDLCNKVLLFKEFIDEREEKGNVSISGTEN